MKFPVYIDCSTCALFFCAGVLLEAARLLPRLDSDYLSNPTFLR